MFKSKTILISLLILTIGLFASWQMFSGQLTPQIKSSNDWQNTVELPYNGQIVIPFGGLINKDNIEQNFTISPEIKGKISWDKKKLIFTPQENFSIEHSYQLTITKQALSSLKEDFTKSYKIIGPAKVLLYTPQAQENIGVYTPLTFSFSQPLIPLSTVEEMNKAAKKLALLQIEPPLAGQYEFIGAKTVTFKPLDRLAYSTDYTITIPASFKFTNGSSLESDWQMQFSTPALKITNGKKSTAIGNRDLVLHFNQAVKLETLQDKVTVLDQEQQTVAFDLKYGEKKEKSENGEESVTDNQQQVHIIRQTGSWGYQQKYLVQIAAGYSGIEGNITGEARDTNFTTTPILKNSINNKSPIGPSDSIELSFYEEFSISDVKKYLKIYWQDKEILFDIKNKVICEEWKDWQEEKCLTEKTLKDTFTLTPQNNWRNGEYYALVFKNEADKVEETFSIAPSFKFLGVEQLGHYDSFCLYFSTKPKLTYSRQTKKDDDYDSTKAFSYFIVNNEELIEYTRNNFYYNSGQVTSEMNRYNPHFCYNDQYLNQYYLQVNSQLIPGQKFQTNINTDLKDQFGQNLITSVSFDNYISDTEYSKIRKGLGFTQEPITTDQSTNIKKHYFKSWNLKKVQVELCQLSLDNLLELLNQDNDNYWNVSSKLNNFHSTQCEQYLTYEEEISPQYFKDDFIGIDYQQSFSQTLSGIYLTRISSDDYQREVYGYITNKFGQREGKTRGMEKVFNTAAYIVSDLSFTIKQDQEKVFFYAQNSSEQTAEEYSLKFLNYQGEIIKTATVNEDLTTIPWLSENQISAVWVEDNLGNIAYATTNNHLGDVNSWNFNINQNFNYPELTGYLYTDRPLYKAGDKVYGKALIRKNLVTKLEALPEEKFTLSIEWPDYEEVSSQELTSDQHGNLTFEYQLPTNSKLGYYRLYLKREKEDKWYSIQNKFYVSEYVKPTFEVKVNSQTDYINQDDFQAEVKANYYFGSPVTKAETRHTLTAQNYFFDKYDGEWFSFNNLDYKWCYFCDLNDQYITDKKGELINGLSSFASKLEINDQDADGLATSPQISKLYNLFTNVELENGQSVSNTHSFIVHRGQYELGVKGSNYFYSLDDDIKGKVVLTDFDGKLIADKNITVILEKIKWVNTKRQDVDGEDYFVNEKISEEISTQTITSNDKNPVEIDFGQQEIGGQYQIKATIIDEKENLIISSDQIYISDWQNPIQWNLDESKKIEIILDKSSYQLGETAKLLIKAPFKDSSALLTFEKETLQEYKVIKIDSNSFLYEFEIKEWMIPNTYISVTMSDKTDFNNLKVGYTNFFVDKASKAINVQIKTDKQFYQPQETVTVTIQTKNSQGDPLTSNVSLAVVDKSLLALVGNPVKNLLDVFYAQKSLGVASFYSLINIAKDLKLDKTDGDKGGWGGLDDEQRRARGEFKDTAHWIGNQDTNEQGETTFTFDLPDNLTTWDIEVVANSDEHFGVGKQEIFAQKPLQVIPYLPNFVLAGDHFTSQIGLFNNTNQEQIVTFQAISNNLDLLSEEEQTITLKANSQQNVAIEFSASPNILEPLSEEIFFSIANNNNEDWQDSIISKLEIKPSLIEETSTDFGFVTTNDYSNQLIIPDYLVKKNSSLQIQIAKTLFNYFNSSLDYLIQFPYGCSEQTASRLLALTILKKYEQYDLLKDELNLKTIANQKGENFDLKEVMEYYTNYLLNLQQENSGGFAFWAKGKEDLYLSSFIYLTLKELEAIDISIPNQKLLALRNYLTTKAINWNWNQKEKTTPNLTDIAFTYYVLSSFAGELDIQSDLSTFYTEFQDKLHLDNKAYLLNAMINLNTDDYFQTEIDDLFKQIQDHLVITKNGLFFSQSSPLSTFKYSDVKTNALILEAYLNYNYSNRADILPSLAKYIIEQKEKGHWGSTQNTIFALRALEKYIEIENELDNKLNLKVFFNEQLAETIDYGQTNILEKVTITKDLEELETNNSFSFQKEGDGNVYYDLKLNYWLPITKATPKEEGYSINSNYFALEDEKMTTPLTELKLGKIYKGEIELSVFENQQQVAIEDFLPAGVELVDFKLATSDKSANSNLDNNLYANHKELRFDRLFLYFDNLRPRHYRYQFVIKAISVGEFIKKPARVFNMYNEAIFGSDWGKEIVITQ